MALKAEEGPHIAVLMLWGGCGLSCILLGCEMQKLRHDAAVLQRTHDLRRRSFSLHCGARSVDAAFGLAGCPGPRGAPGRWSWHLPAPPPRGRAAGLCAGIPPALCALSTAGWSRVGCSAGCVTPTSSRPLPPVGSAGTRLAGRGRGHAVHGALCRGAGSARRRSSCPHTARAGSRATCCSRPQTPSVCTSC